MQMYIFAIICTLIKYLYAYANTALWFATRNSPLSTILLKFRTHNPTIVKMFWIQRGTSSDVIKEKCRILTSSQKQKMEKQLKKI